MEQKPSSAPNLPALVQVPTGTRVLQAAQRGLGRPYTAHLLDQQGTEEHLIIDTLRPDCWTFTEYCLALAVNPLDFETTVQRLRYRNGLVNGYDSRLHYFTEWAQQAQRNGFMTDLTKDLGGQITKRPVNFMSKHWHLYALCAFGKCQDAIIAHEKSITDSERFFIPKAKVASIEAKLADGDIVGITTNIEGLDVSHQGIIAKKANKAYLVHASSEKGMVVQTTEPLSAYLAAHKKHTGVMVFRPK